MVPVPSRACLSAAIVVASMSAGPARAAVFCDVKHTPDGWVALRSAPAADARLVARMSHRDEVMLHTSVANRNGWTRVTWWKGGRFKPSGYAFDKSSGEGWVNRKLLAEECG